MWSSVNLTPDDGKMIEANAFLKSLRSRDAGGGPGSNGPFESGLWDFDASSEYQA